MGRYLRYLGGRYRGPGGQRLMHARVHFLCRCLWCCHVQSILNRLQETHRGGLAREFSGSFGISLSSRKFWVQVTSSFLDGTYAGEQTSLPGKRARPHNNFALECERPPLSRAVKAPTPGKMQSRKPRPPRPTAAASPRNPGPHVGGWIDGCHNPYRDGRER